MSTTEQEAPVSQKAKRTMSPEQKAAMAEGRKRSAALRHAKPAESGPEPTPSPAPDPRDAEIAKLRAALIAATPKPVDLSVLPKHEVYCDVGFCGKKDDNDQPIFETLRDPEDPRWEQLTDVKGVFPSLIVNELERDAAGTIIARRQIHGRQARNTRVARDAWRTFIRTGTLDGAVPVVAK